MATGANDMHAAVHADWAKWSGGPRPYTLGIEEEVMLLDPQRNWALAQRIDDVLEALPDSLVGYIGAETHQAAIELATDPHASVADAVAQLRTLRGQLAGALDGIGLVAGVAGTHP